MSIIAFISWMVLGYLILLFIASYIYKYIFKTKPTIFQYITWSLSVILGFVVGIIT